MNNAVELAEQSYAFLGLASNWVTRCFDVLKCYPELGKSIFSKSRGESPIGRTRTKIRTCGSYTFNVTSVLSSEVVSAETQMWPP